MNRYIGPLLIKIQKLILVIIIVQVGGFMFKSLFTRYFKY